MYVDIVISNSFNLNKKNIFFLFHWRVNRRLESFRLISVQPFIGSIILAFSLSSALCVFVVYIDTVSIKQITSRYGG